MSDIPPPIDDSPIIGSLGIGAGIIAGFERERLVADFFAPPFFADFLAPFFIAPFFILLFFADFLPIIAKSSGDASAVKSVVSLLIRFPPGKFLNTYDILNNGEC
jgi:hypothetical protein